MWKVNDDGQRNMAMVHLNGKKEKHKKQTHLKQYPPNPQATIQILSRPFLHD